MCKIGLFASVMFVWACDSGGSKVPGHDAGESPLPDAGGNDAASAPDAAPTALAREAIVFAAALDGQAASDLYVYDGRVLRLTETAGAELYPTISPDRKSIAFVRDFQLFAIDASGVNERLIAPATGRVRNTTNVTLGPAAWSPDGTQLAYPYPREPYIIVEDDGTMVDESGATTIHIIDADGTNDHVVPNLGDRLAPSINSIGWGPDDTLSFQQADDCPDCAGGSWYAVIKTDGSGYQQLPASDPQKGPNKHLDWSPDGARWVFIAQGGYFDYEEPGRLSTSPAYVDEPRQLIPDAVWNSRWSPDGTQIGFIGADGIYVIAAGGGTPRRALAVTGVRGLDW